MAPGPEAKPALLRSHSLNYSGRHRVEVHFPLFATVGHRSWPEAVTSSPSPPSSPQTTCPAPSPPALDPREGRIALEQGSKLPAPSPSLDHSLWDHLAGPLLSQRRLPLRMTRLSELPVAAQAHHPAPDDHPIPEGLGSPRSRAPHSSLHSAAGCKPACPGLSGRPHPQRPAASLGTGPIR